MLPYRKNLETEREVSVPRNKWLSKNKRKPLIISVISGKVYEHSYPLAKLFITRLTSEAGDVNRILCYGWWPEQVLSKLGYIYHDFIAMELQWNRNQTKKK